MKNYMSILLILGKLTSPQKPQEDLEIIISHETAKSAKRSGLNPHLDIPTFIRQGRVLSIYQ